MLHLAGEIMDLNGAQTFAEQFAKFYYTTYDSNRANLAPLFDDQVSIMSFEGKTFAGKVTIMKQLTELPFKKIQHIITTVDGQPTVDGGYVILVVGQLKTDEDPPHSFSEMFHIKKDAANNPFVLNASFRLSLHNG